MKHIRTIMPGEATVVPRARQIQVAAALLCRIKRRVRQRPRVKLLLLATTVTVAAVNQKPALEVKLQSCH